MNKNNKIKIGDFGISKELINREYATTKKSVESLKEANKKLLQKYEINYNKIFDESSMTKIDLYKNRTDIFILDFD